MPSTDLNYQLLTISRINKIVVASSSLADICNLITLVNSITLINTLIFKLPYFPFRHWIWSLVHMNMCSEIQFNLILFKQLSIPIQRMSIITALNLIRITTVNRIMTKRNQALNVLFVLLKIWFHHIIDISSVSDWIFLSVYISFGIVREKVVVSELEHIEIVAGIVMVRASEGLLE